MNVEAVHLRSVTWAKLVKAEAVAQDGVGEDLPVTLMAHGEDHVLLVQLHEEFAASVGLVAALSATLRDCVVVHVGEVYAGNLHAVADADMIATPRSLAAAFAAGDDRVHEAVVVQTFSPGGVQYREMPYRYALGRTVEWLESTTLLPQALTPYDAWETLGEHTDTLAAAARAGFTFDEPEEVTIARLLVSERDRMTGIARQIRMLLPGSLAAVFNADGSDVSDVLREEDDLQ